MGKYLKENQSLNTMIKTLEKILRFFEVSPVQQFATWAMCAPVSLYCLNDGFQRLSEGNTLLAVVDGIIMLEAIGISYFNEKQATKLYRNHGRVRTLLEKRGWDERIIESKSHSWCDRNMVKVASDDAGFGEETEQYLEKMGY